MIVGDVALNSAFLHLSENTWLVSPLLYLSLYSENTLCLSATWQFRQDSSDCASSTRSQCLVKFYVLNICTTTYLYRQIPTLMPQDIAIYRSIGILSQPRYAMTLRSSAPGTTHLCIALCARGTFRRLSEPCWMPLSCFRSDPTFSQWICASLSWQSSPHGRRLLCIRIKNSFEK